MVLCAFPLQVLISITRCFATVHAPTNRLYKVKKKKKKEPPASHTNKELVFLDGQFAHTGEITARNPTENQHSIAQTGT